MDAMTATSIAVTDKARRGVPGEVATSGSGPAEPVTVTRSL